jgi:hypothetical protein
MAHILFSQKKEGMSAIGHFLIKAFDPFFRVG